jgi:hypothetical protein
MTEHDDLAVDHLETVLDDPSVEDQIAVDDDAWSPVISAPPAAVDSPTLEPDDPVVPPHEAADESPAPPPPVPGQVELGLDTPAPPPPSADAGDLPPAIVDGVDLGLDAPPMPPGGDADAGADGAPPAIGSTDPLADVDGAPVPPGPSEVDLGQSVVRPGQPGGDVDLGLGGPPMPPIGDDALGDGAPPAAGSTDAGSDLDAPPLEPDLPEIDESDGSQGVVRPGQPGFETGTTTGDEPLGAYEPGLGMYHTTDPSGLEHYYDPVTDRDFFVDDATGHLVHIDPTTGDEIRLDPATGDEVPSPSDELPATETPAPDDQMQALRDAGLGDDQVVEVSGPEIQSILDHLDNMDGAAGATTNITTIVDLDGELDTFRVSIHDGEVELESVRTGTTHVVERAAFERALSAPGTRAIPQPAPIGPGADVVDPLATAPLASSAEPGDGSSALQRSLLLGGVVLLPAAGAATALIAARKHR